MTYSKAFDPVFSALADPTRRAVFERLALAPTSVGALAETLPVSRPAVSQHLKVLSDAGLVSVRQDGTRRIYAIEAERLHDLRTWLDRMWGDALTAFSEAAEKDQAK
ncbi:metalloregulator ArsR/SmtB family transcription factor [Rhodobacteraceae bacterium]|nr:metalloregulator ArsR/SmtB family transcription factor [Paracoccaceae bacterium]